MRLYSSEYQTCHFEFNGKEKIDEVTGVTGATYDYGFRIYDPRIGRFLSVDPIAESFPWNSPYAYAENDVIRSIDLDGLERIFYTKKIAKFWKAFMNVLKADELLKKALYTDISKSELKDKVWIYFTSGSSNSMGEARGSVRNDIGSMAYYAVLWENDENSEEYTSTEEYEYYIETLKDLGFTDKDKQNMAKAIKEGVDVIVITVNEEKFDVELNNEKDDVDTETERSKKNQWRQPLVPIKCLYFFRKKVVNMAHLTKKQRYQIKAYHDCNLS